MPLIADANGLLSGSFNIPAGIPVGVKNVFFQGSGGSSGQATYTARGTLITTELQRINTTVFFRRDPLAQMVTLPASRIVGGVDVKITAVGDQSNPIFCQIRETSNGVPTQDIVGEGRLDMTGRTAITPNTQGAWTRILFDRPLHLAANIEYALVFITDDAHHALAIAELGQYAKRLENPREGWVTAQAYQIGELLSSSNLSTWTPHPTKDLTFRLLACQFTQNSLIVDYGDLPFNNTSDFILAGDVERVAGDTDVTWRFTELTGGAVHETVENESVHLTDKRTTNVRVEAELTGSQWNSPIVFPNPQVIIGEMALEGTYISRGIQATADFDATVTFEVFKPGNSNCVPTLERQHMTGGSPTTTVDGEFVGEFVAMVRTKAVPTGNGWVEETYSVSDLRGVGLDLLTRVKLVLTGTARDRVFVRSLRAVIK